MEKNVSNSEWYVLECLWDSAPKTLMQIVEECREKAGWAKSTTATMVKRMGEKGLIRYEEGGTGKCGGQADERVSAADLPWQCWHYDEHIGKAGWFDGERFSGTGGVFGTVP